MSEFSGLWNLSALCRCCHTDGEFKGLGVPYAISVSEGEEIYSNLNNETFGIKILPPDIKASYAICDVCITRLKEASQFRRQVLMCEQMFEEYRNNELAQAIPLENIKIESDFSENDKVEIKPDIDEIQKRQIKFSSKTFDKSKDKTLVQNNTAAIEYNPSLEMTIKLKNSALHFNTICKYTCEDKKQFKNHILNEHSVDECTICFIKCNSEHEFTDHKHSHMQKKTYKHTRCNLMFKQKKIHLQHSNNHNTNGFICDICKKEFKKKYILKLHILKHMGMNRVILCDLCGWKFNDLTNLNVHKRTVHEKLKIFECSVCNKHLSTKKSLNLHSARHDTVKYTHTRLKYSCDKCSKSFFYMSHLKLHKLRHENKFKCKKCKNIFVERSAYLSHLRSQHKREKCLECAECSKMFATKYSLTRHLDTHNGLRKFFCDICLKGFTQKCGLLNHKTRRHGTGDTTCTK